MHEGRADRKPKYIPNACTDHESHVVDQRYNSVPLSVMVNGSDKKQEGDLREMAHFNQLKNS